MHDDHFTIGPNIESVHSVTCQLYLHKTGKRENKIKTMPYKQTLREFTSVHIHFRMKEYSSGREKMIPEERLEMQEVMKSKDKCIKHDVIRS